jgi:hypothetical protein
MRGRDAQGDPGGARARVPARILAARPAHARRQLVNTRAVDGTNRRRPSSWVDV